jgi:hypothetical protein
VTRSDLKTGPPTGWFLFLEILPIVATGLIAAAGVLSFLDVPRAACYRVAIVIAALLLVAVQIIKVVRSRRAEHSRVTTVGELYDRLGPALDLTAELALIDPVARDQKVEALRAIAYQLCGALEALVRDDAKARTAIFELKPTTIEPIAVSGAREFPRIFVLGTPAADEVLTFLKHTKPAGELFEDVAKRAPRHFEGEGGYRTFVRAPIYARGVVFGMVVIDSKKAGALKTGHVAMAELVATTIAPAFAIAAQ